MEIIKLLIPLALGLGACFLGLFIWATKSGQYEDLDSPALRILIDDEENINNELIQKRNSK